MEREKPGGRSGRDLAPALSRGIRILELIGETRSGLTLTEIAGKLGLAKSSVFGLCSTLAEAGMIERSPGGAWRLGLKLVDLANARLERSDLPSDFAAVWESMGVFRDEAAVLSVRDGIDVVYIACRNSPLPLGVTFRIGMRLPACCTATGKAQLSTLSEEDVVALYGQTTLPRLTRSTVASLDALLRQLDEVRRLGYSVDDGETREHMCSFGAPVHGRPGAGAVAGVAISFLKAELKPSTRTKAGEIVCRFAEALSRKLGAAP